jgi:iron complex outermembrane receptor protein
MKFFYTLFFLLLALTSFSQNGLVRGHVYNAANNEPVALGKITIIDLQKGAITKEDGSYEIVGIAPGIYSFKASCPGFKDQIINEITVTNARSIELDFNLDFVVNEQKEILVKGNRFIRNVESPVSLKTLICAIVTYSTLNIPL